MVKYRANYYWKYYIERFTIEKESTNFVWPIAKKGRKEAKHSRGIEICDSFDEAKNFLIAEIKNKINSYMKDIACLEKSLSEVREMEDEA